MKLFKTNSKDPNGTPNRSASSPAKTSPSFDIQKQFDTFYDFFTTTCFVVKIENDETTITFNEKEADNQLKKTLEVLSKEAGYSEATTKSIFLNKKRTGSSTNLSQFVITKKCPIAILWLQKNGIGFGNDNNDDSETLHFLSKQGDEATTSAFVNAFIQPGLREVIEYQQAQQAAIIKKLEDDLTAREKTISEQAARIKELELKQAAEKKQADEKLAEVTNELTGAVADVTKRHAELTATEHRLTTQNASLQPNLDELRQSFQTEQTTQQQLQTSTQRQLAEAATKQQQLQERLTELSSEKGDIVAKQTKKITQLEERQSELERQLQQQCDATTSATAIIAAKTAELEQTQQTLAATQQQLTTTLTESERVKAEVAAAAQAIAQQSIIQVESEVQNAALAKRITELEKLLISEQASHQQLQTTSQQQLADAAAKQAGLEQRLGGVQAQLTDANNLNATNAVQLAQLQQETAAQKASIADKQTALTNAGTEIAAKARLLAEQQQTIEEQSKTQAELTTQNVSLAKRIAELESLLESEQTSKAQLQTTSAQQLALEASKQKKFRDQLDTQEKEIGDLRKKIAHAKKKSEKFASRVNTLENEAEIQSRITETLNKNLVSKTKEYNDLRRKVNRHKKKKASIGEHDIEYPVTPVFQSLPARCSDAFKQVVFNIATKGDGHELTLLLSTVGADVFTDTKKGSLLAATIPHRNIQAARIIRRFTFNQNAIEAAYTKFQESAAIPSSNQSHKNEFTRLLITAFEHPFYKDFIAKKYASLKGEVQKDYFDTNAWIDGETLLQTAARLEDAGLIRIALSLGIDSETETLEEEGLTASDILLQRGKHTENLPECFSILVDDQPLAFNKTRLNTLLGQSWIKPDTRQAIDTKLREPSSKRQVNHLRHYLCIKHSLEQMSDSDQQEQLKKLFQAYKARIAIFLPNQPANIYEVNSAQEKADKEFIERLLSNPDIDETERLCCETLILYIDPYVANYNPQQLDACRKRHNHALAELIQDLINQEDDSLLKTLFENKELFALTGANSIDPLNLKIEDKDIIEYAIDKHAYLFIELLSIHYKDKFTAKLIKQIITYAMDKHAYPLIDMLLKKNILQDEDKKELIKLAAPADLKKPAYPLVGLQLVQTVQDKAIKEKYTERVLAAKDSYGDAAIHLAIKFISTGSLSFIVNQGEKIRNQEFSKSDGCGNTVLDLYRYLDDLKKCVTAEELKTNIAAIQKLLLAANHSDIKTFVQQQGSAQSTTFRPPSTPRSNHAGLTTTPRKSSSNNNDDDDDSESFSFSDSLSFSDSFSQTSNSSYSGRRPPSTPKN